MNITKSRSISIITAIGLLLAPLTVVSSAQAQTVPSGALTIAANTPRTTATTSSATATLVQDVGTIGKDVAAFRITAPGGTILYESASRACTDATDAGSGQCTNDAATAQVNIVNESAATIAITYATTDQADTVATAVLTIPASMLTIAGTYSIAAFFADDTEGDTTTTIQTAITDAGNAANIKTGSFIVEAAITASATGPYTFTAGTAITDLTLTPAGLTAPITYGVNPPLPGNLALNTSTGVISGIPQLEQSSVNYVVTATGAGGASGQITLPIAINAILTPATQPATGVVGTAITPTSVLAATGLSGVITYTSTTRPVGLDINATTGVISGTPTAAGTTTVTITGTDSDGRTATSTVTFTISAAAITPDTQTLNAIAGVAIPPTTAFATSGFTGAVTYTILPALPAGLSLAPTTGVISGTPTVNQAATVHTITATGATSGTDTATITITVASRITPATQTLTASAGTAITPTTAFTPAGFTGSVVYSINPSLPAGLTMSTTTGVISGTPTASQAATTHTITATGTTAGSTVGSGVATATISITVGASVSPTTRVINLTQNLAMTPTAAYTLAGFSGTISYAISPVLPAGLIMNTTTGVISGTPAVIIAPTNYTITVTGSTSGSASTVVTLAIYAPLTAPTGVTATAGDASATVSWNAVTGATGYQVVASPAAGVCTVTGTTATCTGLTNGTRYAFRVTAVNQAGAAALSTLSAQVTPKPPFVTKTGKLTITYTVTGTVVPAASLARIRAIGAQFKADKGTAAVISVKGFTTKGGTAIEKRLASSRAALVARALRQAGLRGTYTTTGDGETNRVGVKARKVVVKYTYTAPN